jgi:hypothetical protein
MLSDVNQVVLERWKKRTPAVSDAEDKAPKALLHKELATLASLPAARGTPLAMHLDALAASLAALVPSGRGGSLPVDQRFAAPFFEPLVCTFANWPN